MWPFSRKGSSGFSSSSTAEQVTEGIDGTGLTAIVTGASSGIGTETSRVLALRGVHVIMGVRNMLAAKDVKEKILKEIPSAKVDAMELDLGSMESVKKFASAFKSSGLPLNILINNAGIMACPFSLSKDKIELQFATNHIGHFLLTNLLLDTIEKTSRESKKEGRIVNVSSEAHRFAYSEGIRFNKINDESSYNNWRAYGQSKLANILHANELTRRLKEDGVDVSANSLHPGTITTNLFRHNSAVNGLINVIGKLVLKNVQQGAATTCYVALHPQVKGISGKYFSDSNVANTTAQGTDADLAKKLWDFSMNLTNLRWWCIAELCESEKERKMWPFSRKGASGFSSSSTAEQVTEGIDGTGLTAIVTGASSGIGTETTRVLSLRGVHVIMGVRNMLAAKDVKETLLKEIPSAKVDAMELDLSSLESVKKFASEFKSSGLPLNMLINNAGIMACPFKLSKDKIELQFATNHLGHFLLTNLLLDTMKKTSRETKKEGRIVNVSSEAHRFTYSEGIRFDKINDESSYSNWRAYGQSKLANILHANELTRRLKEDGVDISANSLHPGVIATNLSRHISPVNGLTKAIARLVLKNVQQGAATTCYVALHPQVKGTSGKYFSASNVAKTTSQGTDADLAKNLWDFSMDLTK
ncbi:Short-chain dehydrogenase TIC 32, chloroplastic [Glycine max]|nr:Short-chain dehydrogenase TIC 32, chloroplastic [Glycine max]